jgi:hypothetical protein
MAKKKTRVILISVISTVVVLALAGGAYAYTVLTDRTPGAVTDMEKAESASTDTITVSWAAAENATGYEVETVPLSPEAFEAAGKELPAPITTTGTSITVSDLVCDEEYTVQVRAYNDEDGKDKIYAEGEAAKIEVQTFAPELPVIADLFAAATSDTEIKLTWTVPKTEEADIDVAKYEIAAADAEDGEYAPLAEITDSAIAEYTQSGLDQLQTKWYKIRVAVGLDGKTFESDWSAAASATTQETPKPAEPEPVASGGSATYRQ